MIVRLAFVFFLGCRISYAGEPVVQELWSKEVPGPAAVTEGEERDLTKSDDKLIAGRRIIKLGHVRTPQMHVYLPDKSTANGGAVLVCPGGGFSILAWDLEGTEVAGWLNSIGFAAIVVKYRTPTRQYGEALDSTHGVPLKSIGPVMDAQRALSLTRMHSTEWNIDPQRIGILGFSAGGEVAAVSALLGQKRTYAVSDQGDSHPCDPNFALLIYPGGLFDKGTGGLKPHVKVTAESPPMFFAMAQDDRVDCENCTALFTALKRVDVPAELHVYSHGGHGYGLRPTSLPVTRWTTPAADWLRDMGFANDEKPKKM